MNNPKNERLLRTNQKESEKPETYPKNYKGNEAIANNKQNQYSSIPGVMDYTFKREGYCVNKYDNNEEYFGYFSDDLRNKHGFYTYKPLPLDRRQSLNKYYFGLWKNDLRDGKGIYLWSIKRDFRRDFDNFDLAKFKAYVGIFSNDKLKKGTYLSKDNDEYFVYHGSFSFDNQREGKNCFYYSNNLEQLLYGTFKNNEFISGYVAKFNEKGLIVKFMEYDSGKLIEKKKKGSILEDVKTIMFNFRKTIMEKDYFGDIFNIFAVVSEFKAKFLYNIDRLNDDKFQDFVKLCDSYKLATIYDDIEKSINI